MDSQIPFEREEARADMVPRRFMLPGKRLPGVILLALLPLVAVAGLTASQATINLEQGGLSLHVDYPRVQRYLNPRILNISVTNHGPTVITDLNVSVTDDFMHAHTGVTLVPAAEYLDGTALVVPLADLAPGETRGIRAELRSNRYWSHSGELTVSGGAVELTADLRTLVLP